MKIQAKQGTKVPKEGKPREYITDGTPTDVPDTVYYRRLVAEGSLVIVRGAQRTSRASAPAARKGGEEL